MTNKEEIIKTYLFAICDTKGGRVDKDNLLMIWRQEFDYLDEKEEYLITFMTACRQIINDSSVYRIPSPDDIKRIIRGNLKPETDSIKKPVKGMSPEFKKVWDEWKLIMGKINQTETDKKNLKELSSKMVAITGGRK